MKSRVVLIQILVLQLLVVVCVSQNYDFFYFVQQWPGSYCDTSNGCCYPTTTGKPATNFSIHGLWPNYNDASYPSNCDSNYPFDPSQISDLVSSLQISWPSLSCPSSDDTSFWSHEWDKHGTCSESVLNEHGYFAAALNLKGQVNLLQILKSTGIQPDGGFYNVNSITQAIAGAVGYTPGIDCNKDTSGNSQLYQIYLCVDTSGANFIECPILPSTKCSSSIEFPSF
ncbi:extracellular ribonuclease LE-like isoform X1 [Telopea speciosissima]|uniref:extracellular ribonuclease LE-like isoform X1 n=1 Tax=Telopea speciosissima TaxID=54955 RepID=UPI001CC3D44B|nr:extracellular ribonuclease LE-like isoform X1 [Telopea speciosissima]